MKITVFTDGSSLIKGEHYESSSAAIICVDGNRYYSCGMFHEGGTNSKGEVYGIQLAYDKLHELFKPEELTDVSIISDSEYVVKSIKSWVYNWSKNGWKTAKGEDVKFKDVFSHLYETYLNKKIRNKNIKVCHINSHIKKIDKARRQFQAKNDIDISKEDFETLVKYNEEVDKLANYIREEKIPYYEKLERCFSGGVIEWEKRINVRIKNGRIVLTRKN